MIGSFVYPSLSQDDTWDKKIQNYGFNESFTIETLSTLVSIVLKNHSLILRVTSFSLRVTLLS